MRRIPYDLLVCRSLNRGIGVNNTLPWDLKPDLEMFYRITTSGCHSNTLIMGRKTYEGIGRALPSRLNIVVSKEAKITENDNLKVARSFEEALQISQTFRPEGKVFVIGGEKIFE